MARTWQEWNRINQPYKISGGGKNQFGVRQDDELVYEAEFDFPTAFLMCDVLNDLRRESPTAAYELDWEHLMALLEERGWENPNEGERNESRRN